MKELTAVSAARSHSEIRQWQQPLGCNVYLPRRHNVALFTQLLYRSHKPCLSLTNCSTFVIRFSFVFHAAILLL